MSTTIATRTLPTRGRKSPGFGHLGVWSLSLGPNSAIPGQRLELAIIDDKGAIVRRFEQIRGGCTDPGYVDFFLGQNCRPAAHLYPLVDIDAEGKIADILIEHYTESMGRDLYLRLLSEWANRYGHPSYAL